VVIGLGAAGMGMSYQTGDLRHMGPGFFPAAVGAIVAIMGVLIAFSARGQTETDEALLAPEWRGWICIVLSIIAFVAIGHFGGLLPATFAIVFISALGDRDNSVIAAAVLALAMCVVCVVVFWWALQLQFPLFTWGS